MPSAPITPQIYSHPNPHRTLLPHLLPLLPYTLPLVRRIQFHFQSSHAHILSTIPTFESESNSSTSQDQNHKHTAAHPFTAAYVDRSRSPETECWIFSTIELPSSPFSPSPTLVSTTNHNHNATRTNDNPTNHEDENSLAKSQLLALLAHISTLPLPPLTISARNEENTANQTHNLKQNQNLLLVGAVHTRVLQLLKDGYSPEKGGVKVVSGEVGARALQGGRGQGHEQVDEDGDGGSITDPSTSTTTRESFRGVVRGHSIPYLKFLFAPGRSEALLRQQGGEEGGNGEVGKVGVQVQLQLQELGLEWSEIYPEKGEFRTVISASEIPREERTLSLLPCVALRRRRGRGWGKTSVGDQEMEGEGGGDVGGELVAWAFLGVDGSLTSLYTAPGYRGKGLGKAVAGRLFSSLLPSPLSSPSSPSPLSPEALHDNHNPNTNASAYKAKSTPTVTAHEPPPLKRSFHPLTPGSEWTHSDVAVENKGSIGVARGLGGEEGWECYWCWVDVGEAARRVGLGVGERRLGE